MQRPAKVELLRSVPSHENDSGAYLLKSGNVLVCSWKGVKIWDAKLKKFGDYHTILDPQPGELDWHGAIDWFLPEGDLLKGDSICSFDICELSVLRAAKIDKEFYGLFVRFFRSLTDLHNLGSIEKFKFLHAAITDLDLRKYLQKEAEEGERLSFGTYQKTADLLIGATHERTIVFIKKQADKSFKKVHEIACHDGFSIKALVCSNEPDTLLVVTQQTENLQIKVSKISLSNFKILMQKDYAYATLFPIQDDMERMLRENNQFLYYLQKVIPTRYESKLILCFPQRAYLMDPITLELFCLDNSNTALGTVIDCGDNGEVLIKSGGKKVMSIPILCAEKKVAASVVDVDTLLLDETPLPPVLTSIVREYEGKRVLQSNLFPKPPTSALTPDASYPSERRRGWW